MFKYFITFYFLLISTFLPSVTHADTLPPFFESLTYQSFFPGAFPDWKLKNNETLTNFHSYQWETKDKRTLSLRYREATPDSVKNVYMSFGKEIDAQLVKKTGQILLLTEFMGIVLLNESETDQSLNFLYGTTEGVYLWKYVYPKTYHFDRDKYIESFSLPAREHQYLNAAKLGNVIMGRWGACVHEYARLLGRKKDPMTEKIYIHLLQTSPANFNAHVEFLSIGKDEANRIESAKILMRDAEDEDMLNAASKVLDKKTPTIDDYPEMSKKDRGLRVILIPLPPCNPWVLEEASRIYEKMTGIPVSIRKLPVKWEVPEPVRSVYRPQLEQIASRLFPEKTNFAFWSEDTLKKEIKDHVTKNEPQSLPFLENLYKQIEEGDFQWDADPLVTKLAKLVLPYHTKDENTMVVGITGTDIFSGSTNYVFSVYSGIDGSMCSILSYAKMKAGFTGANPSRRRLVERIAKEMVPASLKKLNIPRSTDPSCPYSYSSGVDRLDEKSWVLSENVKQAIQMRQTQ